MHNILRNKRVIVSLVLPGMLLFIFAVLAPIILSIYFGMTDYTGVGSPNYVGLKNYKNILLNDPTFLHSLRNALLLGLGFVFLQHPFCIAFAILVDRVKGKAEKFFRAVYFIPCVISVVVTSSMWVNIYNPDFGLLNKVLDALNLGFLKQEWLGNQHIAIWSLLFILIWQGFGWGLLIYYAGIKGISEEMYEAAKIDGATGLKIHTKITIPLLKPVIRVNVTLAIISALKQMETVYLTTNGGPGDSTQFLANYLYIKAFNSFEYGYGNAISVFFVAVCLLSTFVLNKIFKTENTEV